MKKSILFIIVLSISCAGCSLIQETGKVIWGSSTRALEKARADALTKTFQCDYFKCYDAVLSLGGETVKLDLDEDDSSSGGIFSGGTSDEESSEEEPGAVSSPKKFVLFLKDPVKGHVVFMGIPGQVDTTEVGVFFDEAGPDITKVDVSSLSTSAKKKVAAAVFEVLSNQFPVVE